MSSSRISVVVPLYNKRSTIRRALESILSQTAFPREIIIVDDGSTDGSANIVQAEFCCGNAPIPFRLVQQANSGVSRARNRGLEEALGDYVAFLDADDYWLRPHLEHVSSAVQRYPGALLYVGNIVRGRPDNSPLELKSVEFIKLYSESMSVVHTSGCVVDRRAALDLGGFPERHGERGQDIALWLECGLSGSVVFGGHKTSCKDLATSGIGSRQRVLPAPVYTLYPRLATLERESGRAVKKVLRKNLILSVLASVPQDRYLTNEIRASVTPFDATLAYGLRLAIRTRATAVGSLILKARRAVKSGRT